MDQQVVVFHPNTLFTDRSPNRFLRIFPKLLQTLSLDSIYSYMTRTTSNIACPTCHAVKVRLAARKGLTDALLGGFTIYPFRCQLCADRFRKFLGHRTLNPRRSFDRVEVSFPVWFRPHRTPGSPRVGQEGVIENLSIRGCRIRTTAPVIVGSLLELEFQFSSHSLPITIAEAVVRSSSANGTFGLRFTRLHRGEERRIRRIIDVWLPELMPSSL
jgi:hypothetical protein